MDSPKTHGGRHGFYGMYICISLQVLDWIENHGEAFLSKHTGVGKSLHRARALQKRHEDFEEVAQVKQWLLLFSSINTYVVGFELQF